MTPAVLAIDYSTKAIDLAAVQGKRLVYCREHRIGPDVLNRVGVIQRAIREAIESCPEKPAEIWMEKPWVRAGKGINTALELHKVPAQVETIAAQFGLRVAYVVISTWRANILGNGGLRTDEAKRLAVRYAEVIYQFKAPTHNAADAICIASYGEAATRRAERLRRA